jgi:hypothetical protein
MPAPCYHVGMSRKPKLPPDDPEQSKRFIEAAREAGTDESPEAFERVFRRIIVPRRASAPKQRRRDRLAKS